MDRHELESHIHDYLAQHLQVIVKTGESYNGGMGGVAMYDETKTVQLWLNGELISEDSL